MQLCVCLCNYLSSIFQSIQCISIHQYLCYYLYIYACIYLSVQLCFCLSVCLSIHLSVCLLTPHLPLLHSPGPGFAIFSVIQLLLPVMALWLQRSHGEHSYWDVAAANFKHAIGLSCELVVEHVNSFIHSGETLALFLFVSMQPR